LNTGTCWAATGRTEPNVSNSQQPQDTIAAERVRTTPTVHRPQPPKPRGRRDGQLGGAYN
jgi:hypothetical protein